MANEAENQPEKKDDTILMSSADLGNMLSKLVEQMKQPSVLEQRKIDEETAQRIALAERSVEAARQAEEAKESNQNACGHANEKGKHTFTGALQSDGYVRPFCFRCFKEYPPFKANPEMFTGGVNLQQMSGLTEAHFYAWHTTTAQGRR